MEDNKKIEEPKWAFIANTEEEHDEMIEFIKGAFQCYMGGNDRRLLFDFLNKSNFRIVKKK